MSPLQVRDVDQTNPGGSVVTRSQEQTGSRSRELSWEVVDFNQCYPGYVVYTAHDGGVIAGGKVRQNGRFQIVGRCQSVHLNLGVLRAISPVVIRGDHDAARIAQLQSRI